MWLMQGTVGKRQVTMTDLKKLGKEVMVLATSLSNIIEFPVSLTYQ